MALLFMEGFDAYASDSELIAKWHGSPDGPTSSMQLYPYVGRRGTQCAGAKPRPGSSTFINVDTPVITPAGEAIIIGFATRGLLPNSYEGRYFGVTLFQNGKEYSGLGYPVGLYIVDYYDYETEEIGLSIEIYGWPGDSIINVIVPWPDGEFTFGEWHYIEWKLLISNSIPANSCVVKIDGVEVVNVPEGTDTASILGLDPDLGFSRLQLDGANLYDDIYVCDTTGTENNDFLGDSRVDVIRPTGDGTYSQGTPTTGTSHYSLVNQFQYNPTAGIVLDTTEDKESYTMSQLLPSGIVSNNVHGIELATVAYNLDASGSKRMGKLVVQGVSELELNDNNDGVLIEPSFNFQITPTDADAAQWTVNSVNNAQFGIVLKP